MFRCRNLIAWSHPWRFHFWKPIAWATFLAITLPCWEVLVGVPLTLAQQDSNSNTGDAAQTEPARQTVDFNRDIRPILAENCFYCHGQDANQRQADLRLDQRDAAIEMMAIVPGDLQESQLMQRIISDDPDLLMPPATSNRHLSEEQKEILRQWIQQGAEYEVHWAFQNPTRPALPEVREETWCRTPIDRFVLSQLESISLAPSLEAERTTLIKRLYADLIGLPPSPEQVRSFVADPDPLAYEKLVDQLLDDPHYGERMALPWLDAARYADSNGFQQDGDHWQWIWRDQLVRLLNENQPFDEFTIWQLAGDLLPDATEQQKIASGFNRNHMLNGEGGAIAEEQRWVNLFDRVDTTATTWLGLTMACAQCHDHKYDPITQTEYYQFLDAFNRVPERGVPRYYSSRIRLDDPVLELPTEENSQRIAELEKQLQQHQEILNQATENAFEGWLAAIPQSDQAALQHAVYAEAKPEVLEIVSTAVEQRSAMQQEQLRTFLRQYFDQKVVGGLSKLSGLNDRNRVRDQLNGYRADQIPRVMVMSDGQPRETHRLDRGQYLSPLEKVQFGTPAFLPPLTEAAAGGNRLDLARWLVSDQHPLTARVQVNRMWQYFFGQGLVKTSEDFGVQSSFPLHRELLDWLAVEFRQQGWDVKAVQRQILLSATYRQDSHVSAAAAQRDPANEYFSRAARIRMPAMILRDWALAASGLLNGDMGGAPVYPYQPDNVWESLAITKERDFTYPESSGAQLYRRSLYSFWRRTVGPANMFDSSNRQTCRVRAPITSTPLHALTTLNDPTWVEAARHLAGTTLLQHRSEGSEQAFDYRAAIRAAIFQVLCRPAAEQEVEKLLTSFERWTEKYQQQADQASELLNVGASEREPAIPQAEHAAMTVTCLTILNLDEALTRE